MKFYHCAVNGSTFGIKERKKKVDFFYYSTTIDIVDDNNDVCVSAYDRGN